MAELELDIADSLINASNNPSMAERGRIVRKVAALFIRQSSRYSLVQVDLFDSVLMKLIDRIEDEVRVYLSEVLSSVDNAPRRVVNRLASDDAIATAGPVLSHSPCFDEEFLIECARSKGQAHLIAMSSRKAISPRLTDVLVNRGSDQVV